MNPFSRIQEQTPTMTTAPYTKSQDLFLKFINFESDFTPFGIKPCNNLKLSEALNLYRNCYLNKLINVLKDRHEATFQILGPELFQHLCVHYIKQNPSQFWNINKYGYNFTDVIKKDFPELTAEDYPFLSDLMQFELEKELLFHRGEDLNHASDHVHYYESDFNIPSIYKAALDNSDEAPTDWNKKTSWVLYKENYLVFYKTADQGTLIKNLVI